MYSLNDMVALRREIHSFPEPGWCEFVTTSKIVERLKAMGVEPLVGKQIINPEFIAGRNPAAVQAALAAAQAKGSLSRTSRQNGRLYRYRRRIQNRTSGTCHCR